MLLESGFHQESPQLCRSRQPENLFVHARLGRPKHAMGNVCGCGRYHWILLNLDAGTPAATHHMSVTGHQGMAASYSHYSRLYYR